VNFISLICVLDIKLVLSMVPIETNFDAEVIYEHDK